MNTELLLPLAIGCPSAASGPTAKTGAGCDGQAADNLLVELVAHFNGIDGVLAEALALAAPASDQEALLAQFDRAEVFVGGQV